MIGLLALDEAGHPLAGALHGLWPGSRVYGAGHEGPQHDGAAHDGAQCDGAEHDGAQCDGAEHDGAQHDLHGPEELLELALGDCRQLVCFAPVASIVRLLLRRRPVDPNRGDGLGGLDGLDGVGVVCVDVERRFAVSLTGPDGGADDLAGEVSALLGTVPVITGDRGRPAPARPSAVGHHDLPGWDEDVLACPPLTTRPPGVRAGGLVVGVGLREATAVPEVARLIHRTLLEAGLPASDLARLATLTGKGDHPAVRRAAELLGLPVDEHPADELAAVAVPNPSASVGEAVGTTSVAEAAALASAPGGELVVGKQKSATVTVAVARAAVRGRLAVIGLGPGEHDLVVPRAGAELRRASVAVGEPGALALAAGFLQPTARRFTSGEPFGVAVELCFGRL
ncbi:cobalamin biosynthesis protein, partial [Kitasatospora sp. NPDC056181]|uniref:cobalamin biosynthesis protein n=1 Tax=Kitasatospora sp. NPDC056181 TaxID=3345737 RepID=UPI0035DB35B1